MRDRGRKALSAVGGPTGGSQAPLDAVDLDRLRAQLMRAVQRVCPAWLSAQREDIVQAALLRVLNSLKERESNPRLPASYIWKAAYSVTVDEIRRARRRPEVPLEELPPAESVAGATAGPYDVQVLRELGAAIRECLTRLGEARRVAVGFHLMGHKVGEMVTLLGWDEKRLRNLLSRGLADLRCCLSERGLQP